MADPQMPPFITTWMRKRDWGTHHVQWHVVRVWDLLDPAYFDQPRERAR